MEFKTMFTDLKETTEQYDKQDIEKGKLMSILSYFGILCLISYFTEKDNKYVRFHAIQGLNLFLISVIYYIAFVILAFVLIWIPLLGLLFIFVLALVPYLFLVLAILGIVFAAQGKAKEIPVINKIKIIKK